MRSSAHIFYIVICGALAAVCFLVPCNKCKKITCRKYIPEVHYFLFCISHQSHFPFIAISEISDYPESHGFCLIFHCVVYLKMFKTVVVEFKDKCFSLICCIVSHICRFKSSLSVFCRPGNTDDHFTLKLHFIDKFSVDFVVLNLFVQQD